jgi:hypothetical protein
MSLRNKLVVGAFIAVALFIIVPFMPQHKGEVDDLFMNLASEMLGIIITVAIIDQLLDQEGKRDSERRLAWHFLNSVDHAVWIWQGGARGLNLGELSYLLTRVEDSDPLPDFTENRFLNIGGEAGATLREFSASKDIGQSFQSGLEALSRIVILHDRNELTAKHLAVELSDAVRLLVGVLPIEISMPRTPPTKNCSVRSQMRRFRAAE